MERFNIHKTDIKMKSYIGYSNDNNLRVKGTSGGIGSTLIKYLFDKNIIKSSISFKYDSTTLQYQPYIIHSYEDYKIVGSIYHEINIISFIKKHMNEIKGDFACFCLPCQARAIRSILKRNNINSILIGLTCSSQQSIEATKYLLKREHINPDEVSLIQYRGNNWPSGIQITLKNGNKFFISNNNSIWTKIFHSRLFILPQCFKCSNTLNTFSDISLADPWLDNFIKEEKVGKTIIMLNNEKGEDLFYKCVKEQYILVSKLDENLVLKSQQGTIERKLKYLHNKKITRIKKIWLSPLYRKIVTANNLFFFLHIKLKSFIERNL